MKLWKSLGLKFNNYMKKASFWKGVGIFLAATYLVLIPFGLLEWILSFFQIDLGQANGFPNTQGGDVISKGIYGLFFYSVFAPVIETVLSQVIPIRLMLGVPWLRERPSYIICIAGVLFGLMHRYDVAYVVRTFFVGLVLAYMYYLYYTRYEEEGDSVPPEKKIPPFWPVCVVHALRNGIAVIIVLASGM